MNKRAVILPLLIIFVLSMCSVTLASHQERPAGKHFTLVDENSKIVHQTGMQVYVGDEYITADNARFKVVEIIDNDTARCVYVGQEKMPVIDFNVQKNAWIINNEIIPVTGNKKPEIAVYHTHSDESYVPSDGKESINGEGGIYDVGKAFVEKLQSLGFEVSYNKNNHNPHDINAYNRSRKTAAALLKNGPDAIIDIHRDATPPDVYQTEVEGKDVTKVKLVVGRQNPNMKTNLEFAKKIKAVMDKKEPGLSNGIYMGKGDYNQDLNPRAMLIEVGAHTNKKEDAQKGVELFAETLPIVLGANGNTSVGNTSNEPAAKPAVNDNQGAYNVILYILLGIAAVAGGYYFLNKRSISK